MLNPFYWYSAVWTLVFVLYMFDLSGYCIKLGYQTIEFFLFSIIVSLIIGKLTSKQFKYREFKGEARTCKNLTILIIVLGVLNFIYGRDIPLISITLGSSAYTDFQGIPLVYTIYENLLLLNSSITSYLFVETKNRIYLRYFAYMVLLMLLMFHKGIIVFCMFLLLNVLTAKVRTTHKKFSLKTKILILLIIALGCYLNGGLTNIRTGASWNDRTLPMSVCRINDRWPKWLPTQFAWAYTYIVSPLANLNLNIVTNHNNNSITGLIGSILPDAFVKRFMPSTAIPSNEIKMVTTIMNACTGFVESVYFYGIIGLWFFFISYFLIVYLVCKTRCRYQQKYSSVYINVLCMMSFVLFFYNPLRTSAISLLIYLILIDSILSRVTFSINGNKFEWRKKQNYKFSERY